MATSETTETQQKWQYRELIRKTEEFLVNDLNQLGKVGWELVSVSYQKDATSGMGASSSWVAFLKRSYTDELLAAERSDDDTLTADKAKLVEDTDDDESEIFEFED